MKNDLATSIVLAIVGVVVSYFVCNIFFGEIAPVSVKTVDDSANFEIVEPDAEVFNYRAINPTVEVFVGNNDNCTEYNSNGDCISQNNQTAPAPESDQGNQ